MKIHTCLHHSVYDNPVAARRLDRAPDNRQCDPRPGDIQDQFKPARYSQNKLNIENIIRRRRVGNALMETDLQLSLEVLDLTVKHGNDKDDESRDKVNNHVCDTGCGPSDGEP